MTELTDPTSSTSDPRAPGGSADGGVGGAATTTPGHGGTTGLTGAEVAERRSRGQHNDVPNPTSRTYGDIIRANVFTRFNALLGILLVAILAVREYRDALFGIVLVLNTLIGIFQETRAKQTLDRLTLLSAPHARVRRDGTTVEVAVHELVLDDVIELAPGDQISVDGAVLAGTGLEVDESLLTGESDPVAKAPGDEVLSGSFVSAGSGVIQATAVGTESYAYKLREDAARFQLVKSELRDGVNRILQVVQWLLIPTAVLLVWSQWRAQEHDLPLSERVTEAVQGSVAGLVAMVPEGLVLLTSLAFAIGVIRLGRKQVLTQELAAIEGLARVDVICLDKTGTLTEGALQLDTLDHLGDAHDTADVLAALVRSDPNPNPSLAAIGREYDHDPGTGWEATGTVPFSSARKWAAASFADHGSWYLGAPEILLGSVADTATVTATDARVRHFAERGRRVIMLARAPGGLTGDSLPSDLAPEALVVLEEKVRPDAPDTIAYFLRQGVSVKVISGDSPTTVGAVAERVGVPGATDPVDARTLPDPEADGGLEALAEILDTHSVFGRVTPQQKRAMVHALQSRGHEVAMTGDGVNDTLALKDAEIGVAMGSGSPAARSVARFVLLDNSFAVFPSVVAEGRRVIANVERVANLFLTKTFYAMLLSISIGVLGMQFPFLPRQLTIISSLTIGIPAFFLALAPNARRAKPGFLDRVLRFAIPAGIIAGVTTLIAYTVAERVEEVTPDQAKTLATIVLFCIAMWVLGILSRPWAWWRIGLVSVMVGAFLVIVTVPALQRYFQLSLPSEVVLLAGIGLATIACAVLEVGWRVFGWIDHTDAWVHPGTAEDA